MIRLFYKKTDFSIEESSFHITVKQRQSSATKPRTNLLSRT